MSSSSVVVFDSWHSVPRTTKRKRRSRRRGTGPECFYASIAAVEGSAGRTPWDPRLLISLWIHAYSRGIGSARELARRCTFEPAFQWLAGLAEINYHTLSDSRVTHDAALQELFAQVLGVPTN